MKQKAYFPMFVDLSDKKVVIVGAGTIAKRRIRTLIDFTDHLTVIAPEVNQELLDLEKNGKIRILKKRYEREDLFGADICIAAASDRKINNDVYAACRCLGIIVNVCSDKDKCDFYFPRVVRKENLVAGISSSGKNPAPVKTLAEKLSSLLEQIE